MRTLNETMPRWPRRQWDGRTSVLTVLDSDGNSFVCPLQVLDSDGNSFTVSKVVKDSDGNDFTVV